MHQNEFRPFVFVYRFRSSIMKDEVDYVNRVIKIIVVFKNEKSFR